MQSFSVKAFCVEVFWKGFSAKVSLSENFGVRRLLFVKAFVCKSVSVSVVECTRFSVGANPGLCHCVKDSL